MKKSLIGWVHKDTNLKWWWCEPVYKFCSVEIYKRKRQIDNGKKVRITIEEIK